MKDNADKQRVIKKTNELKHRINTINVSIVRDTESIDVMRKNTSNIEFYKKKIEKARVHIKELEEEKESINLLLDSHERMEELLETMREKDQKNSEKHRCEQERVRKLKNDKRYQQKNSIDKIYKSIRATNKTYNSEKFINNRYKFFQKINDTLPPHITKRLQHTFTNECIKWKGVNIYGHRKMRHNSNRHVINIREQGVFLKHVYIHKNGNVEPTLTSYDPNTKIKKDLSYEVYPEKKLH